MEKFRNLMIGSIAFVVIFYNCNLNFGLNIGIFALILLGLFVLYTKSIQDSNFWILSVAVFFSALSFAYFTDVYSFAALFISIIALSIKSQFPAYSILTYPFVSVIGGITSPIRIFMTKIWFPVKFSNNKSGRKFVMYFVFPILLLGIFSFVYSSGSQIFSSFFEEFFKNFHLGKIILLLLIGFLIMFNLWHYLDFREMNEVDEKISDDFTKNQISSFHEKIENENTNLLRKSGIISLILLNIALLAFIFTYNYEQFFETNEAGNLSEETHQRVETVIVSILLAIGLILIYLKSELNFDEKSKSLKKLTFIWLILNFILILSTFFKTLNYIDEYGLTFKRIGVIVFLSVCVIGLIFTYFKIKYQKTNFYLLTRMLKVSFMVFVLGSWINFSWIVTKFNSNFQDNPDITYLNSLPYNMKLMQKLYPNDQRVQEKKLQMKSSNSYQKEIHLLERNIYEYIILSEY